MASDTGSSAFGVIPYAQKPLRSTASLPLSRVVSLAEAGSFVAASRAALAPGFIAAFSAPLATPLPPALAAALETTEAAAAAAAVEAAAGTMTLAGLPTAVPP